MKNYTIEEIQKAKEDAQNLIMEVMNYYQNEYGTQIKDVLIGSNEDDEIESIEFVDCFKPGANIYFPK